MPAGPPGAACVRCRTFAGRTTCTAGLFADAVTGAAAAVAAVATVPDTAIARAETAASCVRAILI